jgi:hypothetical protein
MLESVPPPRFLGQQPLQGDWGGVSRGGNGDRVARNHVEALDV